jgi:hypothetical protein
MTFSTLKAKDGASDLVFLKTKGLGEEADPYVPVQSVELQTSSGSELYAAQVLQENQLRHLLGVSIEKADQLAELIALLTERIPATLNDTNLRVILPDTQPPVPTVQGISIPPHQKVEMEYNPQGNVSEVRYYASSDSQTPLATVNIEYDSSQRIILVTKS